MGAPVKMIAGLAALLLAACSAPVAAASAPAGEREGADPHLWLEQVQSREALDWVGAQNERSRQQLEGSPRFAALMPQLREVLDSPQRLPQLQQIGAHVYNFWRDAEHPRGLWRRIPAEQLGRGEPAWQTVLDLDALARREGENWVWAGASCLAPQTSRCLVFLSRGGADAQVLREFDTARGDFIADGFALPESKGGAAWVDADTISVSTDFGPGSMTESGYPRQVRLWTRGTPLAQARRVFEGRERDVGVWTSAESTPQGRRHWVERRSSFFAGDEYLLVDGRLQHLDKPADADAQLFGEQLLLRLRSDWRTGGRQHPAGALIAMPLRDFLAGKRRFQTLYTPPSRGALQQVLPLKDRLLLISMEEVRQSLAEWRLEKGRWQAQPVPTDPFESLSVSALAGQQGNAYLLTRSSFLSPSRLVLMEAGQPQRQTELRRLPDFFDASGLEVSQLQARSRDGTAVPYFVVGPRGALADGPRPTLLYGYGGFEISLKPAYNALVGRAWLAQGGVYVVANLRGGGEFGPRWHRAAQREHRQRSYDDFIAVAEDLQRRGITRPQQLGIMGGSLGGMLVSVAMQQRPELFGAVVSQVPLTDMRRYHRMLAGASWIEEYGDPDIPEQWAYIRPYSPYHNAQAGRHYPPVLYTSSTRDDRVHPGHARKMVARLAQQGHAVWYWENLEGGHAGAADSSQQARLWALSYSFLMDRLAGAPTAAPAAPAAVAR